MDVSDSTDALSGSADADEPVVSALCTSPDRTVFTEDGNAEGWISTDYTVEIAR